MHNSQSAVPSSSVDAAVVVSGLPVPPKPPGECIVFSGYKNRDGYGRIRRKGKSLKAHRVVWEDANGPIPDGLCLDHLCRNRACVNIDHLELVTSGQNTLRGVSPSAQNARKAFCVHGHLFDAQNTYIIPSGGRKCRECQRQRDRLRTPRNLGSKKSAAAEAARA